jgi:hypothetical protein
MNNFNETELVRRLHKLTPLGRFAFALCCAIRQLNVFQQYSQSVFSNPGDWLREIAATLWDQLGSEKLDADGRKEHLDKVMASLPEEQNEWAPLHAYADDALSSFAYAIQCSLDQSPQEAAWAARRAYEAADQAAIRSLGISFDEPNAESRILSHPIVQRELDRQQRDLLLLESGQSPSFLRATAFTEHTLSLQEMEAAGE